MWTAYEGSSATPVTNDDVRGETWNYRTTGQIDGRESIEGRVTTKPGNDYVAVDAAFSSYGAARIDGASGGSVSYYETDADGSYSGRASSSFTFDSHASTSAQGTLHRLNDDYQVAGAGTLAYSGGFTATGAASGKSNTSTTDEATNLSSSTRTGAAGHSSGDAAYDFVHTNLGSRVSGDTSSESAFNSSIASSIHGTVTDKTGASDRTDPVRDNQADSYGLQVTHQGGFTTDSRNPDPAAGRLVDTSSQGHVTRSEEWSTKSSNFAGHSSLADEPPFDDDELRRYKAYAAPGYDLRLDQSKRTVSEEFDYDEDNGAVTREGTFDDDTQSKSERRRASSFDGGDTSGSYREDTSSESTGSLSGPFTDNNGDYSANAAIDNTGEARRATELTYAHQSGEQGNRQAENFTTNTKGASSNRYSGAANLTDGLVTQGAGDDQSQQRGRVKTTGAAFEESSSDENNVKSYANSSSSGTTRGEQSATGDSKSTGPNQSSGDANASASGHLRGRADGHEQTVDTNDVNRVVTVTDNTVKNRGNSQNTADGQVTQSEQGESSNFDVTNQTEGNDEYKVTRNVDTSTADSRRQESNTRSDNPTANLTGDATIQSENGRQTVEAGLPTGETGSDTTIDYDIKENSRFSNGSFATPQYYYAKGKRTDNKDATFKESDIPGDLEALHASLVRELGEEGKMRTGSFKFYVDPTTLHVVVKGERITRVVDANRTNTSSADMEASGELVDGTSTASVDGGSSDRVEVVEWKYDIGGPLDYQVYDKQQISTITTTNGEDTSGRSIVNHTEITDRKVEPLASDTTLPETTLKTDVHDQTQTTKLAGDESSLTITSDRKQTTTVDSAGEQIDMNGDLTITSGADRVFTLVLSDFADNTPIYWDRSKTIDTVTENSHYHATHKLDDGLAKGGEFNASNSYENTHKIDRHHESNPQFNSATLDQSATIDDTQLIHKRVASEHGEYHDERVAGKIKRIQTGEYTTSHTTGRYIDVDNHFKGETTSGIDPGFLYGGWLSPTIPDDLNNDYYFIETTKTLDVNNTTTDKYTGKYGNGPITIEKETTVDKVLHQFKDHEVKYAPYALAANDTEETVFTFSVDQRLTEQRAPEKPQVHLETYHALGDQQGNLYDDKMQYVNYDDKGIVIYATAIDDHYDEYYQRDPTIAPTPLEPFVTYAELRENGTIDPGGSESNLWAGTKAFGGTLAIGIADFVTDELPYVGQAKAADKLINNRNLVTGEQELGALDRYSSVIDLIPGGSTAKKSVKGIGTVGYGVYRGGKALANLAGFGGKHADSVAKAASGQLDRAADASVESAEALKKHLDSLDEATRKELMASVGGCFAADTPVVTPRGSRPICDFQPGDTVLAFDHNSGKWSPRRVAKVHRNVYEDSLVTIHTDTESIRATVYHPVWVLAGRNLDDRPAPHELEPKEDEGLTLPGRWVNSHDLRPGDVLLDTQGNQQCVIKVEQEFVSNFDIVNLTIEGDHTYAVGTTGLLVHNTSARPVAVDVVADNLDATESLRRLHPDDADVLDDALTQGHPSGSYINQHASGTPYIGKGGPKRAAQSALDVAKRTGDPHVSTQWESAIDETQGLIDEARKIRRHGGIENLHNRINSPGEKLL